MIVYHTIFYYIITNFKSYMSYILYWTTFVCFEHHVEYGFRSIACMNIQS